MATERIDIVVSERGSKVVRRDLEGVGAGATTAGKSVDFLKNQLLQLAAVTGIGMGLASAVQTMADFSQQMQTVAAVSDATTSELARMREEAKNLGSTTRYTASQAAEAMTNLSKAGFTVAETMETTGATLMLAQAGALDLGTAASIASNVLRAFRLDTAQAGHVVDILAAAANKSNTDVTSLGEAMKYVGPVAAGLRVPLEETAAAIAALADAGLDGSMAGTGLRQVLSELEAPTGKTRTILANMGLTAKDVQVSSVGLTAALQALAEKGITTGEALLMFGDRGGPAFEVLQQAVPKIKRLNNELENSEGSAKRVAEIMDKGLKGAVLETESAFEGLVITIGELGAESALERMFRNSASALREFTSLLQDSNKYLDDFNSIVKITAAAFVLAFGSQIVAALVAATNATLAFSAALLANPITAIPVLIGAAVAALFYFRDATVSIGDSTLRVGDIVYGVWNSVKGFLGGVIDQVFHLVNALGKVMALDFAGAKESLNKAMASGAKAFEAMIGETFVKTINAGMQKNTDYTLEYEQAGPKPPPTGVVKPAPVVDHNAAANRLREAVLKKINVALKEELELTKYADRERRIQEQLLSAEKELRSGLSDETAKLTAIEKSRIETQLRAIQLGEDQQTRTQFVKDYTAALGDELAMAQLNSQERAIAGRVMETERALKQALNDDTVRLTEAERFYIEEQARAVQATANATNVLEGIRAPANQYAAELLALNELLVQNKINTEEFAQSQRDARIAFLETKTDFSSGFERGLLKMQRNMDDFASAAEEVVTNAFGGMEDALVQFATTGKLSFASFANAIVADIARIAIRAAITRPLMTALGFSMFKDGGYVQAMADGGAVTGPGGPRDDKVPAMLSAGEYVINADATRKFRPLLEAINGNRAVMSKLASGGPASAGAPWSAGGGGAVAPVSTTASTVVFAPSVAITVEGGSNGNREDDIALADRAAAAAKLQFEKMFAEFVRKENRPGGMLNNQEAF
jgi:TP901 family phage tail tape measure protein/lambda family phage tail tape measure protein